MFNLINYILNTSSDVSLDGLTQKVLLPNLDNVPNKDFDNEIMVRLKQAIFVLTRSYCKSIFFNSVKVMKKIYHLRSTKLFLTLKLR